MIYKTMIANARSEVFQKPTLDIAHMVGRWSCSNDPAATARGWFRDNPAERNRLDDLFATGRITHPFTGTQMNFRRECFGLVGRNRRYVWVMDGMTVEEAGKMLPPVIAG